MTLESDDIRTAVGRERIATVTKVVLGVGALVFVLGLASLLPGLDLLLPETGVALAALVGALVTLAVVGLLVYLAAGFATLTRVVLDGPAEVVENVASVVYWLVVLVAVLVAHAGLAPLVTPLLGPVAWLYDLAFLALALGPLAVVAARLSVTLDPAADLLADSVVSATGDDRTATDTTDYDDASGDDQTGDHDDDR